MDQCTVAFIVKDENGTPIEAAYCHIVETQMCGYTNSDGYHAFGFINKPGTYTLEVLIEGYDFYSGMYAIDGNTDVPIQLHKHSAPPIPPGEYTRNQIIHVKGNLCNLRDASDVPIFDCNIADLILHNLPVAEDWIKRLIDGKSTHVDINLSGDYDQNLGWISRYPYAGNDFTNDIPALKECLNWLLGYRMIPHLHLACDGQGTDPVGWTYGWQWGMDNMPHILPQLEDYTDKVLWNAGYDGCFPNWSPDQLDKFYKMLRNILGDKAQLAAEFGGPGSIGYCHLGAGAADWAIGAPLDVLDVFCTELQEWPLTETNGVQQTSARLLGPKKRNISPANDGPYYIPENRTRGELGVCYYETLAYWAMRKYATPQDAIESSEIGQHYGFEDVGNGVP